MNKKHADLIAAISIPVAVGALILLSFRAIDRALEKLVNDAFDWSDEPE